MKKMLILMAFFVFVFSFKLNLMDVKKKKGVVLISNREPTAELKH